MAGLARRLWRLAIVPRGGSKNRDLPPRRSTGARTTGGPSMKKLLFSGDALAEILAATHDTVVARVLAGGHELGRHGGV